MPGVIGRYQTRMNLLSNTAHFMNHGEGAIVLLFIANKLVKDNCRVLFLSRSIGNKRLETIAGLQRQ